MYIFVYGKLHKIYVRSNYFLRAVFCAQVQVMSLLKSFINKNSVLLCAGLAFFAIGIVIGSIVAVNLSATEQAELKNSISGLVSHNAVNSVSFWDIVASESISYLRPVAVMGLCAYSVWLVPLSAFAVGVQGYKLGFTISFLCGNFGLRGIVLTLVSSLASYVVAMPVYIGLFAITLRHAIVRSKRNGFQQVGFSLWVMLIGAYGILCAGSCVQGLLLPIFIDFFTS